MIVMLRAAPLTHASAVSAIGWVMLSNQAQQQERLALWFALAQNHSFFMLWRLIELPWSVPDFQSEGGMNPSACSASTPDRNRSR